MFLRLRLCKREFGRGLLTGFYRHPFLNKYVARLIHKNDFRTILLLVVANGNAKDPFNILDNKLYCICVCSPHTLHKSVI